MATTNNELIEYIKNERGVTHKTVVEGDYLITVRCEYTKDHCKTTVTNMEKVYG